MFSRCQIDVHARLIAVLLACLAWALVAAAAPAGDCGDIKLPIELRDGVAEVPTLRIMQGDRVQLQLTGPRVAELHLHGYDRLVRHAGGTSVICVHAVIAGRFPLSSHDGSKDARKVRHRVVAYLEVAPR
jgi:hypothetical protein